MVVPRTSAVCLVTGWTSSLLGVGFGMWPGRAARQSGNRRRTNPARSAFGCASGGPDRARRRARPRSSRRISSSTRGKRRACSTVVAVHEFARIEPAQLDRDRDALVTAAWVRRIEEPATLRHEPLDTVARTLQPLAERRRRDVEHLGGRPVIKAHDDAEDVGHPMRRIQAQQHRQRATDAQLLGQQLGVHVGRRLQAAARRRKVPELLAELLEARPARPRAATGTGASPRCTPRWRTRCAR